MATLTAQPLRRGEGTGSVWMRVGVGGSRSRTRVGKRWRDGMRSQVCAQLERDLEMRMICWVGAYRRV